MTIAEVIDKVDSLVSNTYSQEDKVGWLSQLEWIIKTQIIDTHQGGTEDPFYGYDSNTDPHALLLVPAPFDDVYLRWLEAQIHYYNGETDRYNAAIIMYNTSLEAYANHYKRTHRPLHDGRRFIF